MNAPAARFVLTSMNHQSRRGAACVSVVAVALALGGCDVKVGDQGVSFDVTQGRKGLQAENIVSA